MNLLIVVLFFCVPHVGALEFTKDIFDVKRTLEILRRSNDQLNLSPDHRKLVLIMGRQGSGKTTLSLILNKDLYRLKVDKNLRISDHEGLIHQDHHVDHAHPNVFITQKETHEPEDNPENKRKESMTIVDLARLHDQHDMSMEIASQYFFRKAINHAREYKIILMISDPMIKEMEENDKRRYYVATQFTDYLEYFVKLINITEFNGGIGIVFNDIADRFMYVEKKNEEGGQLEPITVKRLKEKMWVLMNHTCLYLDHGPKNEPNWNATKLQKKMIKFLKYFTGDNSTYEVIQTPLKAGFLIDDPSMVNAKFRVEKFIRNLKFQKKQETHFRFFHQDYIINEVDALQKYIIEGARASVQNISTSIIEYFKQKVDLSDDLHDLRNYLRLHSIKIKTLIKNLNTTYYPKKFYNTFLDYIKDLPDLKFSTVQLRYIKDTRLEYLKFAEQIAGNTQFDPLVDTWGAPIKKIKQYIDDTRYWIIYMIDLYKNLINSHALNRLPTLKPARTFKETTSIINKLSLFNTQGSRFINLPSYSKEMVLLLNQIILDTSKSKFALRQSHEYYNKTKWMKLRFTGNYLRTSFIFRHLDRCGSGPCIVQLFAKNDLVVDCDIKAFDKFQLHIIAPTWNVTQTGKRHLLSADGVPYYEKPTDFPRTKDDLPPGSGLPGNPAGCISGFGNEVTGGSELIISASGSDGQPGESGLDADTEDSLNVTQFFKQSLFSLRYFEDKQMNECMIAVRDDIREVVQDWTPVIGEEGRMIAIIKGFKTETGELGTGGGQGGIGGPKNTIYLYLKKNGVFQVRNEDGKRGTAGSVGRPTLTTWEEPDFQVHYFKFLQKCVFYYKGIFPNETEIEPERIPNETLSSSRPYQCRRPSILFGQYVKYASRYFKDRIGRTRLLKLFKNYFTDRGLIEASTIDYEKAFSLVEKVIDQERNVDVRILLSEALLVQLESAAEVPIIGASKQITLHFMFASALSQLAYVTVQKSSNISLPLQYTVNAIERASNFTILRKFEKASNETTHLLKVSLKDAMTTALRVLNIFTKEDVAGKVQDKQMRNHLENCIKILNVFRSVFHTLADRLEEMCIVSKKPFSTGRCDSHSTIVWVKAQKFMLDQIDNTLPFLKDKSYLEVKKVLKVMYKAIKKGPDNMDIASWKITPQTNLMRAKLRYIGDHLLARKSDILAHYVYAFMHAATIIDIAWERLNKYYIQSKLHQIMTNVDLLASQCVMRLCRKYLDKIVRHMIFQWDLILKHKLLNNIIPFGHLIHKDLFPLKLYDSTSMLMKKLRSNLYSIPAYFTHSEQYFNDINQKFLKHIHHPDQRFFNKKSFVFAQWRSSTHPNLFRRFLKGKKITLSVSPEYDVRKGHAIKLVQPNLDIRPKNFTKFDEKFFKETPIVVKMKHIGISYYRCGGRFYANLTPMKKFVITMNEVKEANFSVSSLVKRNPISPYGLWEFTLNDTSRDAATKLQKYLNAKKELILTLDGAAIYPIPTEHHCKSLPYFVDDTIMGISSYNWS